MRDLEVLIAHAKGEEEYAEKLARPLRGEGYKVSHRGTGPVGISSIAEATNFLTSGGPIVVCGTLRAMGSEWTSKLVNAAHDRPNVRVFVVQMDEEADVDRLAFATKIAAYWKDPKKAIDDLKGALRRHYPLRDKRKPGPHPSQAERLYRKLLLESCNIIDLVNLPGNGTPITTRHPELGRLYVPRRVRVKPMSRAEAGYEWVEGYHKIVRREDEPSIGSRLAECQRLVVLGEPGAGKSTLLRWIATAYLLRSGRFRGVHPVPGVESLPRRNWLPIMIRCRDLDEPSLSGSLRDILYQALYRLDLAKTKADATPFLNKVEQGRALLLIDGLDEITDLIARIRFCQHLEVISRRYKRAPIIVTSRTVGYREMRYSINNFEHVTLSDFSEYDKKDFVRRWCNVFESSNRRQAKKELMQEINSRGRIERLTSNPMLLTAMALVKRRFGRLRIRKVDLYADLLEVLLHWRHDVQKPLDKNEAIPQLEYLAYEMCHRGVPQFLENDIITLLTGMREKEKLRGMRKKYPKINAVLNHTPEDFLGLLERQTGILTRTGQVRVPKGESVPLFEFQHPIFCEYLAACALVGGCFRHPKLPLARNVARLAGQTKSIEPHQSTAIDVAITETWREVLRLCVASCSDDNVKGVLLAILEPMKGENSGTTARPRAVLAALCLSDEPKVKADVVKKVLREFVRQIGPNDGKNYGTGVDNAVRELASSQWAGVLLEFLDQERKNRERRSDPSDSNVGSLGLILREAMIQLELNQLLPK